MSALGSHWSLSEETKDKMRKTKSEEHRKHISEARRGAGNPLFGKPLSEEHRKKISESEMGRKLSDEHKAKLSGANNSNSKKVMMIDSSTGKCFRVWDSTGQASRELGISQQNISSCCRGKRKTAGGYIWQYMSEVM